MSPTTIYRGRAQSEASNGFQALGRPLTCPQCGHSSDVVLLDQAGPHLSAFCEECRRFVQHVPSALVRATDLPGLGIERAVRDGAPLPKEEPKFLTFVALARKARGAGTIEKVVGIGIGTEGLERFGMIADNWPEGVDLKISTPNTWGHE